MGESLYETALSISANRSTLSLVNTNSTLSLPCWV